MINKFLNFLLSIIIFYLITLVSVIAAEQFNFDITELQIIENGNKFKGLKRGSIVTNDGIKISADTYEYNKLTNILNATGNVKIVDEQNDYIIFAENVTYLKNQEKIYFKNKLRAEISSKYNLISKDVTFLRDKKELYSAEDIEIKDKDLILYKLKNFRYNLNSEVIKGYNIEIVSDYTKNSGERDNYFFDDGIINLKTKNFNSKNTKVFLKKNVFGEKNNDPRLYGVSSNKSGEITTINKGIFTSCELDRNCVPWSIKADKIIHNKNKKQLIYENAFMNIYDIPVAYFPKFFHPDPSVKRQSGVLIPQVNNSEILGSSIIIPYYHVISDNKDLTVTPTIFDTNISMLQSEYRQKNKNSYFVADLGHVQNYKSTSSNNKNSISHLFAKFNSDLNLKNFTTSTLNFNFEKTSNDIYLKIFDTNLITNKDIRPSNLDNLSSNVDLKLSNDTFDLSTGMSVYENLYGTSHDRYQYVFPYYSFSKSLLKNEFGNFYFISNGVNDLKDTNVLRTSLTNDLQILGKDFYSKIGLKNNFGIYFKNLNTLGKNYSNYKSSPQSEIMSIYNFETSLPLIKYDKKYLNYFTPKISFRTNPGDMKNYSESNRKIYASNIFSIDRLGIGSDSFEKGTSVTLGINYTKEKIDDINKYFSIDLASVVRDVNENKIPNSSTIGNTTSNLIGSSKLSLSEKYQIEYNFSIDNNLNDIEYNNLIASYYYKNFMTKFNFIEENGKIGSLNSIENTTKFKFDEDKYLYFNTRRNRETSFTEYYDLIYEYRNDCLTANVKYKKTYYQDRDLIPGEDLIFSITLFPLSTFEQKINQGLYRN